MDDPKVLEALIFEHSKEELDGCREVLLDAEMVVRLCNLADDDPLDILADERVRLAREIKLLVLQQRLYDLDGGFGRGPMGQRLFEAENKAALLAAEVETRTDELKKSEEEVRLVLESIRGTKTPAVIDEHKT